MANPQPSTDPLERNVQEARMEYQRALGAYKDAVEIAAILPPGHPNAVSALERASRNLEDSTRAYAQALTAYTSYLIRA